MAAVRRVGIGIATTPALVARTQTTVTVVGWAPSAVERRVDLFREAGRGVLDDVGEGEHASDLIRWIG
jgi:hypothetical protein